MASKGSTPMPLANQQAASGQRQERPIRTQQRTRPTNTSTLPEWLMVVLALAFVFVGLPVLMPILWALYLLTH